MYFDQSSFMSQRPSFKSVLRNFITDKSFLNRLIVINVVIYFAFLLLSWIFSLIGFFMKIDGHEMVAAITNLFACPADFQQLLRQPWSIFTSLFIHASFWHLFFNMLMLYVSGKIFKEYLSDKLLLITYLFGGVFGNLIYMIAYNIFPVFSEALHQAVALGASGSIMAILAAITAYRPNHEVVLFIFGRMKLFWITLVFVVIDLLSIPQGNAGGHIAHIGGVLYGTLFIFIYAYLPSFFSHSAFQKNGAKTKKRKKKFYTVNTADTQRPLSDEEYNAQKVAHQKRIDEILDKISKNGYDALSKEEKEYLFYSSKK